MTSPNARNIVVTKSKYGPAAIEATSVSFVKLEEEARRVRAGST